MNRYDLPELRYWDSMISLRSKGMTSVSIELTSNKCLAFVKHNTKAFLHSFVTMGDIDIFQLTPRKGKVLDFSGPSVRASSTYRIDSEQQSFS